MANTIRKLKNKHKKKKLQAEKKRLAKQKGMSVDEYADDYDISKYPIKINEGIIDFKEIDWVLNIKNYGVIEDLRVFLDDIKNDRTQNYHLVYDNSKLLEVIKK